MRSGRNGILADLEVRHHGRSTILREPLYFVLTLPTTRITARPVKRPVLGRTRRWSVVDWRAKVAIVSELAQCLRELRMLG